MCNNAFVFVITCSYKKWKFLCNNEKNSHFIHTRYSFYAHALKAARSKKFGKVTYAWKSTTLLYSMIKNKIATILKRNYIFALRRHVLYMSNSTGKKNRSSESSNQRGICKFNITNKSLFYSVTF